jgi:hypothetical protein
MHTPWAESFKNLKSIEGAVKTDIQCRTYNIRHPRINFSVFDDLVGDASAFKRGHSEVRNLCINGGHLQCNLLFTTQYIKAIPPVLRRNLDIFVILNLLMFNLWGNKYTRTYQV